MKIIGNRSGTISNYILHVKHFRTIFDKGLVALMTLNILKGFDFQAKESVDTYHKQIRAMKLAFADGEKYITEESKMRVKINELLSKEYGDYRRKASKWSSIARLMFKYYHNMKTLVILLPQCQ